MCKGIIINMNKQISEDTSFENEYALDPAIIRAELEDDVDVVDLPAIEILEKQINRDFDITLHPSSVAKSFVDEDFYGLVINQPKDILPAFDVLPNQGEVNKCLNNIKLGTEKLTKEQQNTDTDEYSGWLWIKGNMQERIDTYRDNVKYRIYLSPAPENTGDMIYEIGSAIPEHTSYWMKTFDSSSTYNELQRGDKIIIYCTNENFNSIVNSISEVTSRKPYLKDRPTPGGGTYSPTEGISFAKEFRGTSGSEIAAYRIKEELTKNSWKDLFDSFTSYESKERLLESNVYKTWEMSLNEERYNIVKTLENNSYGAFDNILKSGNDKIKENFENLFFYSLSARLNRQLSPLLGKDKEYIDQFVEKAEFVETFGKENIQRLKDFISNPNSNLKNAMNKIAMRTALTISIQESIRNGRKPGEGLRKLLSRK